MRAHFRSENGPASGWLTRSRAVSPRSDGEAGSSQIDGLAITMQAPTLVVTQMSSLFHPSSARTACPTSFSLAYSWALACEA